MKERRLIPLAAGFVLILTLVSLFSDWIAPYPFDQQNIAERLQGPTLAHIAGTDSLGRDLFSRILFGARYSLLVGYFTTLIALVTGTFLGMLAAFRGGWVDALIMRSSEVIYSFPSVLTATLLLLFFKPGLLGMIVALSLTNWVTHARLIRIQTLQLMGLPLFESARAIGCSPTRILLHHLLPNLLGPVLVSLAIQVPNNIMSESFLSFLGLGLQPPHSSWGTLAQEGFRGMMSYPHLMIYPGTALFVTMMALNYCSEGLRTWLDPKSRIDFRH